MELKQKIIDALKENALTRADLVISLKESGSKIAAIVDDMILSGDLTEDVVGNRSLLLLADTVKTKIKVAEVAKENQIYNMAQSNQSKITSGGGSINQLNQVLMQQLTRLTNAKGSDLEVEVERSRAISQLASEVTKNHAVTVDLAKIQVMQGSVVKVDNLGLLS